MLKKCESESAATGGGALAMDNIVLMCLYLPYVVSATTGGGGNNGIQDSTNVCNCIDSYSIKPSSAVCRAPPPIDRKRKTTLKSRCASEFSGVLFSANMLVQVFRWQYVVYYVIIYVNC